MRKPPAKGSNRLPPDAQREPHPQQRAADFSERGCKPGRRPEGARDIIAELVSENERARNALRNTFARQAVLTAKVIKAKRKKEPNTGLFRLCGTLEAAVAPFARTVSPFAAPKRKACSSEYQPRR